MKALHLTALLCVFFTSLFAKNNFKPGYIIKANNDTIRGLIDYGAAVHNAAHCSFRKDSASTVINYLPAELKGYGFTFNRHFVTKEVKLEAAADSAYFFLEYLVKGPVDLYFLDDRGLTHFFIEQKNVLYELTNDPVKIVENGVTYTKTSNKYKGILKYALQNVPGIQPDIERTAFNRKSLVALLEKYYRSLEKNSGYVTYHEIKMKGPHEKWKFHIGLNVGYNHSNMNVVSAITTKKYMFPASPTVHMSIDPIITGGNFPDSQPVGSSNNNLFPGLLLNFRSGKNTVGIEVNYNKNNFTLTDFKLNTQQLILPITYKREFGYQKKLMPYINIGLCLNYTFSTDVENLYLNYMAPDENGYNFKYVTKQSYVSSQNSSIKKGTLGPGVVGELGLSYHLTKKNTLQLGVIFSFYSNHFTSDFDDHIHIRTTMIYSNIAVAGGISF